MLRGPQIPQVQTVLTECYVNTSDAYGNPIYENVILPPPNIENYGDPDGVMMQVEDDIEG
jgi:hypothetical protein